MSWVRKKFKKCKVYVLVDEKEHILLNKNGFAQIKYSNKEDEKIYNASKEEIVEISSESITKTNNNVRQKKISPKKTSSKSTTNKPTVSSSNEIIIYTDGACTGNPGPAGIGILLISGKHQKEISEYIGEATNNIAELKAIKKSLEILKTKTSPITIYTDSQYSLSVLNGAYKAKKNKELIKSIQELLTTFTQVQILKVLGHSGVWGNEKADDLATSAIKAT